MEIFSYFLGRRGCIAPLFVNLLDSFRIMMKNCGCFLFCCWRRSLAATTMAETTYPPSADQHVTCEISAPADGAEVDMSAKMTIEGDAEIDAGKISKVTLTVGGKVVSDVTSVPFTYDYEFAEDQAAGEFKIALAVEGDAGAKASDEVTVTLKAPEQHLTCTISEPAEGGGFRPWGDDYDQRRCDGRYRLGFCGRIESRRQDDRRGDERAVYL